MWVVVAVVFLAVSLWYGATFMKFILFPSQAANAWRWWSAIKHKVCCEFPPLRSGWQGSMCLKPSAAGGWCVKKTCHRERGGLWDPSAAVGMTYTLPFPLWTFPFPLTTVGMTRVYSGFACAPVWCYFLWESIWFRSDHARAIEGTVSWRSLSGNGRETGISWTFPC